MRASLRVGAVDDAFSTWHPAVPATALASLALVTMCALQPVYAALSLAGALAASAVVRGPGATARGLRWQLPAVALVALANPLFTASGSTLLVRVGPVGVYVEALAFGLTAGAVMVASIVWLECLATVVPPSAALATAGRAAPACVLAATMTAQLVPQLLRRYDAVVEARGANTASRARPPKTPFVAAVTHSGVLLGWALEDSIARSDVMRARGWGATRHRTSYRAYRLRLRDVTALLALSALVAASALLAWVACAQWRFYPTMPQLVVWWGYVPFALLAALPAAGVAVRRLRWRHVAAHLGPTWAGRAAGARDCYVRMPAVGRDASGAGGTHGRTGAAGAGDASGDVPPVGEGSS